MIRVEIEAQNHERIAAWNETRANHECGDPLCGGLPTASEMGYERYTLTVRDGSNGEILLSSTSQGYSRAIDAEDLARRLFAETPAQYVDGDDTEAVVIRVTYANGKTKTEGLR